MLVVVLQYKQDVTFHGGIVMVSDEWVVEILPSKSGVVLRRRVVIDGLGVVALVVERYDGVVYGILRDVRGVAVREYGVDEFESGPGPSGQGSETRAVH